MIFKIGKNDKRYVPKKISQKLNGKLLPLLLKNILNWIETDKISAPIHKPKVKSSMPSQREIPKPLAMPIAHIGPHIEKLNFNY